MTISRRTILTTGAATMLASSRARAADDTIRIGVLTDLSGIYREGNGCPLLTQERRSRRRG